MISHGILTILPLDFNKFVPFLADLKGLSIRLEGPHFPTFFAQLFFFFFKQILFILKLLQAGPVLPFIPVYSRESIGFCTFLWDLR